ncbi:MAG: GNAT family N-acetyltransferase, partial [Candidatus Bathyarchaeota archaeon]|nr:GNAT family N-acetyltransferase [Candidatus Bathyarchaeota archaeon]
LGIAPLMYSVHKMFGLRMGKIEFVGAPASDYNDFLLTDRKEECIKAFVEHLSKYPEKWDCIQLTDIRQISEYIKLLSKTSRDVHVAGTSLLYDCPYIPLPKSFDTYFSSLTSNFRYNLRRGLRQLQKKYAVEFKEYSNLESFREGIIMLFKLHQNRWEAKNKPGIFSDNKAREFHLDIAKSFSERGWLGLSSLLVDGKAVASLYGFKYGSRFYAYIAGMYSAFYRYGVSNLLLLHNIEKNIEEGLTEVDFLRGGEPYKYRWKALDRSNFETILIRKGLLPRIRNWLSSNYWTNADRLNTFLRCNKKRYCVSLVTQIANRINK